MLRCLGSLATALGLLVAMVGTTTAQPADPQPGCRYFEETAQNICDPFLTYWEEHDGIETLGFPRTEATTEMSIDLERELQVQYFERGRLEEHPENAGTPYHVVLGRLGSEVLGEMDRNWHAFPKADSTAAHYTDVTGHAIAPEFWDYWSSRGLELGDDGTTFRESLALFGYPISGAETETNVSGDTVLTQWFERARFELHGNVVRLGLLGDEYLALRGGEQPPPTAASEVIAEGLENPRGLTVGPDGVIFVTEAGAGGDECQAVPGTDGSEVEICFGPTSAVTRIEDGELSTAAGGLSSMLDIRGDFVGVHDAVVGPEGTIYAVVGLGADPATRESYPEAAGHLGLLLSAQPEGEAIELADIAAYESAANPDNGLHDSNPFSLTRDGAGGWIVSDAGMNALLRIDGSGEISTLAVFEERPVTGPDGSQVPMQAVPTGVAVGPDGAFYVGELTGFPFEPGSARVWRVSREGEAEIYADGFTNVIDVAFDDAGNLYVLELVSQGLLNVDPEDPASMAARLAMVTPDGAQTTVAVDGLAFATGLAAGPDSTLYVSNLGVMPGMGQVVKIDIDH